MEMEVREITIGIMIKVDDNSYCLVCHESEEYMNENGEEQSYEYINIDTLKVAEDRRRQGLGRKLLRKGIEIAKKLADDKLPIRLLAAADETVIDEASLVAFYESEGFVIEDTAGAYVVMQLYK